jgi:acetolactate synthase regulatory subunit
MIEQDYRPLISFPEPPELAKVDRANMAQLVVETEKCPLILSRVLEVVRDHDAMPFTIAARRDSRIQIIEIELSTLPQRPMLAILQDLRRLSNVRLARFLLPAD